MYVLFYTYAIVAAQWTLCIGELGIELTQPLLLTPLIETGQLDVAREKSLVLSLPRRPSCDVSKSYSGFLTVNKKYNSNLFFWYFPAQVENPSGVPVLLWLQGGPGSSSLFGLFVEHGPLYVTEDLYLKCREYAWTSEFHMLYIDQPVGTGFSFTDSDEGYARNQTTVAEDLYQALLQFFTLFPELQQSDFYVTGQSYAGKYVPAISQKLHQQKPDIIRFKGLAIGNGWIDPKTSFIYSEYLYQLGLVDENQKRDVLELEDRILHLILQDDFVEALHTHVQLALDIRTYTGLNQYYNSLYTDHPGAYSYYERYLDKFEVRRAIHVGNLKRKMRYKVASYLQADYMKSSASVLAELMEDYKVLIYSGQFDIIVAPPLTNNFLLNLNWSGSEEFMKAEKTIWKVDEADDEVAGYVKRAKNMYQVLIRNAGHVAPYDQPRASLDMITRFVKGISFSKRDSVEDASNSMNWFFKCANLVYDSLKHLIRLIPWKAFKRAWYSSFL